MNNLTATPIGKIVFQSGTPAVKVFEPYIPALEGLTGFSHLQVFWWFDACDNEASRKTLSIHSPYQNSPELLGAFATRSPERPNPIALSTAEILRIDPVSGIIELAYIDAHEHSPVIDLKPYTPSLDRVEHPRVPAWCTSWPKSLEESADFDWENVFTF